MGILNREIEEVELLPIARGIVARWWIVLIAALVGTLVMWSQESDLSTTPALTEVNRTYESRDETAMLSLVGIDPVTVSPFPSFSHQLIQVQQPAIKKQIAEKTGLDLNVGLSRTEQRFSLLDTLEGDGKTKFTFLSVGTPIYTLMCVDASPDNCNIVLDEYEQRLTELRKESIVSGIERLQSLLEAIPLSTPENLEKIEALKASKLLVSGQLALLSTEYVSIGSTVTTVKSTTYLFGFGAGAFVGLLIALQLAVIDKRIRSQRQLSQRLGVQSVIGNVVSGSASRQHAAAAIVARAQQHGTLSVVFIPATSSHDGGVLANQINEVCSPLGVVVSHHDDVMSTDAKSLLGINGGVVVVATMNHTTITDVIDTVSVIESAQKTVLGVILTD
jgi:hypothetical protein